MMVEMRWIVREAVSHEGRNFPCFKTVDGVSMVLQFRHYRDPEMPGFTEWMDVPTVMEE